jgi:diguanylate cyclase (GGDEF)-like protein
MHLLDLENNTVKEYNARDEVSRAARNTDRADEIMNQMTTLAVEDNYMDEALKFTDVSTLADRMQDKKMISSIFISKAIGWFRASFITIEKDWSGRPKKVLFVTQNINKEKKKEEELIFKSNVDELTGLYNRRAYEEHIAEHKDTVTEENFVFVSLDVNGLKRVNDSLGHAAGDELIKGAADCLKQCFAPYGRIYRVGGDEFSAMIFANEKQLEKIKSDFAEVTANWSGQLVKSLSISSGFVPKREVSTTSVHEMSNIADKKMYEAKEEHYRIYGK